MTIYGITGAGGFLGWHVRTRLHIERQAARVASRETFGDPDEMDEFVRACDVIIHLAGVNRGEADEVENGNIAAARTLADAKTRTGARFALAFANSTQAGSDSAYGRGKQAAAAILAGAQEAFQDPFIDVVLPHVFGEHGRPFYNSAVATFSHQLAHGDTPQIIVDGELELLHAQDAAAVMLEAIAGGYSVRLEPGGTRMIVSEALTLLQRLATPYLEAGVIPEMADRFEVRMFNMFRSHLFPSRCPLPIAVHGDERGDFYEAIRSAGSGQASISTTRPGATRGDHFHVDKIERFVVVSGEAVIRIRRLLDDTVHEFRVTGAEPVAIDMPTLHPHNITNVGDGQLITQFWANELFDPARPDTIREPVANGARV